MIIVYGHAMQRVVYGHAVVYVGCKEYIGSDEAMYILHIGL